MDLYSAFIEVPHTQGAQVQITQCYLQITLYLPLPRKQSPDGASPDWGCGHLIAAYYSFIYPERMKGWVGLGGWLRIETVYLPKGTNQARCRATALIETNALLLHQTFRALTSQYTNLSNNMDGNSPGCHRQHVARGPYMLCNPGFIGI